jgi:hypothetical protein
LLDHIEGYPAKNVFIVIPCFLDPNNERKYLNKVVQMEVVTFYCSVMGQQDILKTIERNLAP